MRQKHPKHPANSGRPHPPVLFIFENIERVDLALIFFSSLLEARAGFLDRPVFVVLAVSVALAVTAMALTYAGFFGAT